MIRYTYGVDKLEEMYGLPDGFLESDSVIIDNELSKDIAPDWKYEEAEVCVVGFLFKKKIEILCAESSNDEDFKKSVRNKLDLFKNQKMFAFNKHMEIGNFSGYFGIDVKIEEIKPFKVKGWNKDYCFKELIDKNAIPKFNVIDPLNGKGILCFDRWEKFQKTKDEKHLKDIVMHNMNCLIKEKIILDNKKYYQDNYEIDSRGWLVR